MRNKFIICLAITISTSFMAYAASAASYADNSWVRHRGQIDCSELETMLPPPSGDGVISQDIKAEFILRLSLLTEDLAVKLAPEGLSIKEIAILIKKFHKDVHMLELELAQNAGVDIDSEAMAKYRYMLRRCGMEEPVDMPGTPPASSGGIQGGGGSFIPSPEADLTRQ